MTSSNEFDYIIIGGGSAGCVLANRLSADGDTGVLLLEAGGRDTDPWIKIPVVWMKKFVQERRHDWGYDTEPEPHLDGRTVECVRARVLGGCSSINAMSYVRGSAGDYDRWAAGGLDDWSYSHVLPYLKRSESWEGGADDYRGGDGELSVRTCTYDDPLIQPMIKAAEAVGLPLSNDYNGEQNVGIGRMQQNIKSGRRWSAADAFLRPALSRTNLTLQLGALVTKVTIEDGRAVGVDYVVDGQTRTAKCGGEILVSAGALNSPHILMLSGIGPADDLRAAGIDVVVDAPNVGQNLQDHISAGVFRARKEAGPFVSQSRLDRLAVNIVRAYLGGGGPADDFPGGITGFYKTDQSLTAPDIQLLFSFTAPTAHPWFPGVKAPFDDAVMARPVILHPESRGSVEVISADPNTRPRLRQNFFSEPADLEKLRSNIKLVQEMFRHDALAPHLGVELAPGENATDEEIDAHIKRTCVTVHHPCGTCAMGTGDAAVIDGELKVRGIDGLRIADASAMPDLTSGNIHAAVLMIAEKASDMILGRPALPATDIKQAA